MTDDTAPLRVAKKPRTDADACLTNVQQLLTGTKAPSGRGTKIRNSLNLAKEYFEKYGFRTALVQSPREGLSVYRDSCVLQTEEKNVTDKEFLLAMLGLHPEQAELDESYDATIRYPYCATLFCHRIREICGIAVDGDEDLVSLIRICEEQCRAIGESDTHGESTAKSHSIRSSIDHLLYPLMERVVVASPGIRIDQLHREFDRIVCCNSTLANAYLQLWMRENCTCIKEIYYKDSRLEKLQRLTIFFFDPELDEVKPPPFSWIPCLSQALREGPEAVAKSMAATFWSDLLRRGYFASRSMKDCLSAELVKYFLFGLSKDPSVQPLLLNAHFVPTYPLSFYFHGKAGVGKSSLARLFSSVMNRAIQQFADPEMLVRFVKQNLNKAYEVLELELDLRPNNNDLSVMSIVQGRRMTMAQAKPGIVIVGMEEMPNNRPNSDPNQLQTAQLIAQRFSGRKGNYRVGDVRPNFGNQGISNDASIVPLFTSNYPLDSLSVHALSRLKMFSNLQVFEMQAVNGCDRKQFAVAYLKQTIHDRFPEFDIAAAEVRSELASREGDMRPLVKALRMITFCIVRCFEKKTILSSKISVTEASNSIEIRIGEQRIDLHSPRLDSLVLHPFQIFDSRTQLVMDCLKKAGENFPISEMAFIVDLWLAGTLAPAVILSCCRERIASLLEALQRMETVNTILAVDVSQVKMMKSLYDPKDTPNLRDEILKFGRGANVVVELLCDTVDSQMRIREMIEDTPSMTAFSTENSALNKSGLLFCVVIKGDITPEIKSRASLML